MSRLNESFNSEVRPALMSHFGYTNAMQVPRLEKIVINMGVGEACLLYTSPSPRDVEESRMPSSA